ncbi:hypothetical protein C0Q70_21240 [Pomacea canaliculata]|uniref:Uncharacterized protein n=1 Tax=Pomacea canaliculata TaxID=400727 RepID=A0A2T7NBY6_POMCA|nr:hypothetical protein C0Q70_21240 [Pomacea canaliculata]
MNQKSARTTQLDKHRRSAILMCLMCSMVQIDGIAGSRLRLLGDDGARGRTEGSVGKQCVVRVSTVCWPLVLPVNTCARATLEKLQD